jgi:exopolysaccharide biosynthesis predicted pyruvyltransferase EpsI
MISPIDASVLDAIRNNSKKILRQALGGNNAILLIGYPSYKNPGDALIWLGAEQYLHEIGIEIMYRTDIGRFDQKYIDVNFPGIPILLTGGGNFGDLWPVFQDFRESIVFQNPERLIIQLPQSIQFKDFARQEKSRAVFASHSNLILMFRESASLRRAKLAFPEVDCVLCPDMAFGHILTAGSSSTPGTSIALLREDREKSREIYVDQTMFKVNDWHFSLLSNVIWLMLRSVLIIYKRIPGVKLIVSKKVVNSIYARMSSINLKNAIKILSPASYIVTDRLHAHVLACLMGIRHVIMDNSYGKISSMYVEYSGLFSSSKLVSNQIEFNEQINGLIQEFDTEDS